MRTREEQIGEPVIATEPHTSMLLNVKEVSKRTSLSRTTIWRWLKGGRFPEPLRLSENCVRWRSEDVDTWVRNLTARQAQ